MRAVVAEILGAVRQEGVIAGRRYSGSLIVVAASFKLTAAEIEAAVAGMALTIAP